MTINKTDIKLFASKVMTDESDGGGEMTGIEIVSGEHNSIFPDISDLDRAYGVVNIRSTHVKIDSPNDDTYFGATVGLTETPVDPNVDITLMSVNNPYIMRDETRDIIERYLTNGVKYQGELFNDQIEGQRAIRIMQYKTRKAPTVGDVLVLRDKQSGFEQYCKLVKVTPANQQFYKANVGNYWLKIVTCEISEPLRQTFVGGNPDPNVSAISGSEISETTIADASKYFGTKSLKEPALLNESALRVDGIYTQLVPSARVDTPHINVPIVDIIDATIAINASGTVEGTFPINLESQSFPITLINQGYVYVQTLLPYPTAGTLSVHYMAQGNWYTLRDRGDGILEGEDTTHGTGTIDALGNVAVTLGALPDVSSEVIFQWGSTNIHTELIKDEHLNVNKTINVTADTTPNTDNMVFTWDDGKVANCIDGVISGDAEGYVNGDKIAFTPNDIPAKNALISTSWEANVGGVVAAQSVSESISITDNGTQYLFTFGDVIRGEFTLRVAPTDPLSASGRPNYTEKETTITLLLGTNQVLQTFESGNGRKVVGAFNKESGDVVIEKSLLTALMVRQTWDKKQSHWWKSKSWTVTNREMYIVPSVVAVALEVITTRYIPLEITPPISAGSFDFSFDTLSIKIAQYGVTAVSSTLLLSLNDANLSVQDSTVFDDDVAVGSYDKTTQLLQLDEWSAGSGIATIETGIYSLAEKQYVQDMVFLTAGNPIASQSLQVNAIDENGKHCIAVADVSGRINGDGFEGYIDTSLGIVRLANDNPVESFDIKYNAVSYNYLPLDAELLGLDPIRLPSDGRVVIYEKGDVIVVHQDEHLLVQVDANSTLNLDHVRLTSCTTTAADALINLDAGMVHFPTAGSYEIDYRIEDMALITYADISGALKLSRPLSHNYDADKAKVASVLIASDLFARYTNLFDQKTWTGAFSKNLIGSEATAEYNDTLYPIQVTNDGCITERFAIVFTSSTNFKLIGEHVGQIAVGNINNDFSPNNPVSNKPYFTLNKLGWGTGWATNNVLRIDFYGAVFQMNIIRTIQQGESENPVDNDKFELQIRCNINKEVA